MTGGSIYEDNTFWERIYTCSINASTLPSGYNDDSFRFSLTISRPTVPDPPADLRAIAALTTST